MLLKKPVRIVFFHIHRIDENGKVNQATITLPCAKRFVLSSPSHPKQEGPNTLATTNLQASKTSVTGLPTTCNRTVFKLYIAL